MSNELWTLPTIGYEQNLPDPSGTADVFRRIGYTLNDAVADLVDNSIDAGANRVLIRFFRDARRIFRIVIVDDGRGMSEGELKRAMQYGVRSDHRSTDLGKYGIGLKSASFSQCKSLSVISKQGSIVAGRRWTLNSIEQGWRQEVIDPTHSTAVFQEKWGDLQFNTGGTLVVWDDLDAISAAGAEGKLDRTLSTVLKDLPVSLGLRFHRFIESARLSIAVDTVHMSELGSSVPITVSGMNPFGYLKSGKAGFPTTFHVSFDGIQVPLVAHIWPPNSGDVNYRLGRGSVAARQGFYFYRNERLIQAGGWNGLQNDTEPHYSLARVCVDLPPQLDGLFRLSVQKSKIEPPPSFIPAVERAISANTTFREYLSIANDVYRSGKSGGVVHLGARVGKGIPSGVARELNQQSEKAPGDPYDFVWARLEDDQFFEIRRDSQTIVLNSRFRKAVLAGSKASAADAPLIKTLIFLLLRDELGRQRGSRQRDSWLRECNLILTRAVNAQKLRGPAS